MTFKEHLDEILKNSQQPMNEDPYFFGKVAADISMSNVDYGYVAEFGVASGRTVNMIADVFNDRVVYGFDWFQGLPENWNSSHHKGIFACAVPDVKENVELVVGRFQETVPKWNYELESDNIPAFIHMDADLYSSTKYVLDVIKWHVQPGTIILFDELYYLYDGDNYKHHEYKALLEFQEFLNDERGLVLEFYGQRHSESFAFKVV